jgi:hypothetical protein
MNLMEIEKKDSISVYDTDVTIICTIVKWAALLIVVASIQAVKLLEIYVYCSRNPSSGSGLSETGSLDRAKAALERRKKASEEGVAQARVEETRVNPDNLINEILRSTNLEPHDESGTSSITSSWKDGGFVILFNSFDVKKILV